MILLGHFPVLGPDRRAGNASAVKTRSRTIRASLRGQPGRRRMSATSPEQTAATPPAGLAGQAKPLGVWREALYTWLGLGFTIAASIMVAGDLKHLLRSRLMTKAWLQLAADLALVGLVYYLIFGTVL